MHHYFLNLSGKEFSCPARLYDTAGYFSTPNQNEKSTIFVYEELKIHSDQSQDITFSINSHFKVKSC